MGGGGQSPSDLEGEVTYETSGGPRSHPHKVAAPPRKPHPGAGWEPWVPKVETGRSSQGAPSKQPAFSSQPRVRPGAVCLSGPPSSPSEVEGALISPQAHVGNRGVWHSFLSPSQREKEPRSPTSRPSRSQAYPRMALPSTSHRICKAHGWRNLKRGQWESLNMWQR